MELGQEVVGVNPERVYIMVMLRFLASGCIHQKKLSNGAACSGQPALLVPRGTEVSCDRNTRPPLSLCDFSTP